MHPQILQLELSAPRPPAKSSQLLLFALSLGIVVSAISYSNHPITFGLLLLSSGILFALLWPIINPPKKIPNIVLEHKRLRLPASIYRTEEDKVDLRDVVHTKLSSRSIQIMTKSRRYRIPTSLISNPDALEEFEPTLLSTIKQLDDGEVLVNRILQSSQIDKGISKKIPIMTLLTIVLIIVVQSLQLSLMGFSPNKYVWAETVLRFGAFSPAFQFSEPWRAISSTLIHPNIISTLLVCILLWQVGKPLEQLLGSFRWFFLFSSGNILSACLLLIVNTTVLVPGPVAANIASLSSYWTIVYIYKARLPVSYRPSGWWWALLLLLSLLMLSNIPFPINIYTLLLSPVIGILTGYIATHRNASLEYIINQSNISKIENKKPTLLQYTLNLTTTILLILNIVSISFAIVNGLKAQAFHQQASSKAWLFTKGSDSPSTDLAIKVLGDKNCPRYLRAASEETLSQAIELSPDSSTNVMLAWSELLEAKNEIDAAVKLRWKALTNYGPGAFEALVEGVSALNDLPITLGGAEKRSVEIRRQPGDDKLTLLLDPKANKPQSLFFLLLDTNLKPQGLFEFPLALNKRRTSARIPEYLRQKLDQNWQLKLAIYSSPPLSQQAIFYPYSAKNKWRKLHLAK